MGIPEESSIFNNEDIEEVKVNHEQNDSIFEHLLSEESDANAGYEEFKYPSERAGKEQNSIIDLDKELEKEENEDHFDFIGEEQIDDESNSNEEDKIENDSEEKIENEVVDNGIKDEEIKELEDILNDEYDPYSDDEDNDEEDAVEESELDTEGFIEQTLEDIEETGEVIDEEEINEGYTDDEEVTDEEYDEEEINEEFNEDSFIDVEDRIVNLSAHFMEHEDKYERFKALFGNGFISDTCEDSIKEFFYNSSGLRHSNNIVFNEKYGIREAYCPICGSVLSDSILNNPDVSLENFSDGWLSKIKIDKNTIFEYIGCDICKDSIITTYDREGKLYNPYIIKCVEWLFESLGLIYLKVETEEFYEKQPLYPTDLFMACDEEDQEYVFSLITLAETIKTIAKKLGITKWSNLYEFLYRNDSKLKDEFYKYSYDIMLNYMKENSNFIIEENFEENVENNVECKHNCKDCPKSFIIDNLNEVIEYNGSAKGNRDECLLYKDVISDIEEEIKNEKESELSIENLPELTKKEIDILDSNPPSDKDIEKYSSYYSNRADLSKDLIEELAIRDYIEDKIKEKAFKEQQEAMNSFKSENETGTKIIMDDDGHVKVEESKDSFNEKNGIDSWFDSNEEIERQRREEDKKERMNYKRVSGDILLSKEMEKAIEGIKNEKNLDPALEKKRLKELFLTSCFGKVLDYVLSDEYNTATAYVSCGYHTNYIPIIDFDTGYRFICIDTEETISFTYRQNPIVISNNVNFYFRNKEDFKAYVLYKPNCKMKLKQTAACIVKLVNFNTSYPKSCICHLNDNYIPFYNVERELCNAFFQEHSPYSFDKFHVDSLVIAGVINKEEYKESIEHRKREIFEQEISRYSSNKNLRPAPDMAVLAGIRYYSHKVYNSKGVPTGRKYVITQYTENINLILDNGFWYCVLGLMKEHERAYNMNRDYNQPRMTMEISFEMNRDIPPSPVMIEMINQDGCLSNRRNWSGESFEIPSFYKGFVNYSTKPAGLIPRVSDREDINSPIWASIIDIRYLQTEAAMRRIFGEKIDGLDLRSPADKKKFLVKKGFDDQFTIPEEIRFEIKFEALKYLIESEAFHKLAPVSFKNYDKQQIEDIVGDYNALNVKSILGDNWEKLYDSVDNKVVKNAIKRLGENLNSSNVKELIGLFFGK